MLDRASSKFCSYKYKSPLTESRSIGPGQVCLWCHTSFLSSLGEEEYHNAYAALIKNAEMKCDTWAILLPQAEEVSRVLTPILKHVIYWYLPTSPWHESSSEVYHNVQLSDVLESFSPASCRLVVRVQKTQSLV